MTRRRTTGLVSTAVVILLACGDGAAGPRAAVERSKKAEPSAPQPVSGADVAPFDDHFGIYLNGSKVGWMRTQLAVGPEVAFSTELHARVGGMGQVSEITLRERRRYAQSGGLASIDFSQTAATGAVEVHGKRMGARFVVETTAGGATSSQDVEVTESLEDTLAPQRLARSGKVGDRATSRRFDPSVLKVLSANHVVSASEKRAFAGVETEVMKIETRYPDLGIDEAAWVDRAGKLLESRIGGFFVARLEPADVAKRLDYSQDLLVSAVVPVSEPLLESGRIAAMRVGFTGFGASDPPSSPRQGVKRQGDVVTLTLARDPERAAPWKRGAPTQAELAEFVTATPFIQSDDARLRDEAKRVVGDATDVRVAAARLSAFVYAHVRDEYVPAYSNALEAWSSRRGDCTEHSVLYVALARAAGIPARVAVGIAYWPPARGFGWHAWAEVHDGGGWLTVDPTWNQSIADATHIKLAEGGPAEQARIVMLLGALKVVSLTVGERG